MSKYVWPVLLPLMTVGCLPQPTGCKPEEPADGKQPKCTQRQPQRHSPVKG